MSSLASEARAVASSASGALEEMTGAAGHPGLVQALADLPDIHRARNPLAANYSASGFHQDRWVVPTRHPERLREALATLPVPPGVVIGPATADRESQV